MEKREKNENKIFILIFLGMIAVFFLFYGASFALSKQKRASQLENRGLEIITMPTVEGVRTGEYMKGLDNALQDQVFLRQEMVIVRSAITRAMSKFAYLPLADPAYPIDYETTPLFWEQEGVLVPTVDLLNEELYNLIDMRAKEYNEVKKALPEVNFNIYSIEERGSSSAHPTLDLYKNPSLNTYEKYFLERLAPQVAYDSLELTDKEKFLNYFYKTDHHLAAPGVYELYSDTYDMLAKTNNEMGEKLVLKDFVPAPLPEFRGSLTRSTAFTDIYDTIYIPEFTKKPELKTYVNGIERVRSSFMDTTQQTPTGLFIDWYIWYFGEDVGLVTYENLNPPNDRNLLIVGSSYTQSMENYLASHYKTTQVVDLRHYGTDMGIEFNIIDFINANNIDDVIVITTPGGCYLNADVWALMPQTRADSLQ